jgi:Lipid A 3-O-deacylase (PagL)
VGVRWFVTERLAFNFECGYIHISDANTALPNYGVNAFGASLGLSCVFGPTWR